MGISREVIELHWFEVFEAVMVCSQEKVLIPADTALACPGTLAQNEELSAVVTSSSKGRGERPSTPPVRDVATDDICRGRCEVNLVVQAVIDAWFDPWPLDDKRYFARFLVGCLVITIHVQFTEVLTVVGRYDYQGLFEDTGPF